MEGLPQRLLALGYYLKETDDMSIRETIRTQPDAADQEGRRHGRPLGKLSDADSEARIASAVEDILYAIGEDSEREGLRETPDRVARMYAEVFAGLDQDPREVLSAGFDEGHDEMVIARDIEFFSMCEHHLLPFFGKVHIGYIPRGRVVGISKLARVVDILSKRPQLQERLTSQIGDAIVEGIEPMGVGVVLEAEHLCMMMRGVRKPGSSIVTSVTRGCFREDARTRSEFLELTGCKAG